MASHFSNYFKGIVLALQGSDLCVADFRIHYVTWLDKVD